MTDLEQNLYRALSDIKDWLTAKDCSEDDRIGFALARIGVVPDPIYPTLTRDV